MLYMHGMRSLVRKEWIYEYLEVCSTAYSIRDATQGKNWHEEIFLSGGHCVLHVKLIF